MASLERAQEIANRGIQDQLPPERRAKFDEMVRRGMITLPGQTVSQPQQGQPAQTQQGQTAPDIAMGILQLIASTGNAIAGPIVGGVAGTAQALNPLADVGAGADAVQATKDFFIVNPGPEGAGVAKSVIEGPVGQAVGDAAGFVGDLIPDPVKDVAQSTFEAVQQSPDAVAELLGPLAGAVAKSLPEAFMTLIPGLSAIKKARNIPITIADDVIDGIKQQVRQSQPQTNNIKTGPAPELRDYTQISDDLKKQKTAALAAEVLPDQEIIRSAKALGVDLNPSHYSTNRAFIDIEQSLKSRPGSKLATVEEKAILDTGRAADNLIQELGGATDKSLLDINIRDQINGTIADLEVISSKLYKSVGDAIPLAVKVEPSASRAYINNKLSEFGGDKALLTTAERELLRVSEGTPTYAALDRVRKNVGSALGKKSGPFKDDDSGILGQLYKVLSEDQQGVADAYGVGAYYASARKTVATRKAIESEAVDLFGRDVAGSILPKMTQAAAALTKGDLSKFKTLMASLPKNRRREVAATMLNEIFTSGARKQGSLSSGFVGAFELLNRNAGAKNELFKHLPPQARKRFNNIGRVATGIFRSKALENNSKTARDMISAMDDGGLLGKLYGLGGKVAVAESISTTVGLPGAGTAAVVGSVLAKAKTPATQAADELLTSPAFKKAVQSSALGDTARGERIITASRQFKKWLTAQPPDIRTEVASLGFISWLTNRENNDPRL